MTTPEIPAAPDRGGLAMRASTLYNLLANPEGGDLQDEYNLLMDIHCLGGVRHRPGEPTPALMDETDWHREPGDTVHCVMDDRSVWTIPPLDPDLLSNTFPTQDQQLCAEALAIADEQSAGRSQHRALLVSALTAATGDKALTWDLQRSTGLMLADTPRHNLELNSILCGEHAMLRVEATGLTRAPDAPDQASGPTVGYILVNSTRVPETLELYRAAEAQAMTTGNALRRLYTHLNSGSIKPVTSGPIITNIVMLLAQHTRNGLCRWRRENDEHTTLHAAVTKHATVHLHSNHPAATSGEPSVLTLTVHAKNGRVLALNTWHGGHQDDPEDAPALPLLLAAINGVARNRAEQALELPPGDEHDPALAFHLGVLTGLA